MTGQLVERPQPFAGEWQWALESLECVSVRQDIPGGTFGHFTNPLWFVGHQSREGEAQRGCRQEPAPSPKAAVAKAKLLWDRQGSVGAAGSQGPHVPVSGWKMLSGSQSLCLCAETLNPQSFVLCTLGTDNL